MEMMKEIFSRVFSTRYRAVCSRNTIRYSENFSPVSLRNTRPMYLLLMLNFSEMEVRDRLEP